MTILGSKVDDLPIEEDQEELHPNVKYLGDICKEANCTGMTCNFSCMIYRVVNHLLISKISDQHTYIIVKSPGTANLSPQI